jgi:3',5'-cyclic AMP phosphodiesterase CpdA
VVHTGDLVSDGRDTKLWPTFFNIEKELLRKTAFFPVPGNHERNNPQYFRFLDVRRPYSSFDWGAVHIVLLDTDLGNMGDKTAKEEFWAEQMRWLEQDLARAGKAALRLAIFHHPPITAVKRRQDGNPQVQTLMPVFEKYKVQGVFNGHDHNYQHHVKNGIHYIVTGGGGAPLYDVDGALAGITMKVERTEHYCTIKVTGRTARVEAIALDGHLIDTVDIK